MSLSEKYEEARRELQKLGFIDPDCQKDLDDMQEVIDRPDTPQEDKDEAMESFIEIVDEIKREYQKKVEEYSK